MRIDKITIGDLKQLRDKLDTCVSMTEWKEVVKIFATEHGIKDREAIDLANLVTDHFKQISG